MKYLMKADARLTEATKNVFGDVVSVAYSCCMHFRDGRPRKADYTKVKMYMGPATEIDNGAIDMCIEFTNGRKVLFTNSEWGTMQSPQIGDLIVEGSK